MGLTHCNNNPNEAQFVPSLACRNLFMMTSGYFWQILAGLATSLLLGMLNYCKFIVYISSFWLESVIHLRISKYF